MQMGRVETWGLGVRRDDFGDRWLQWMLGPTVGDSAGQRMRATSYRRRQGQVDNDHQLSVSDLIPEDGKVFEPEDRVQGCKGVKVCTQHGACTWASVCRRQ